MDYIVICLVAFIASGLTLFSGFGLGTLLTPVFALFFPIDIAIAVTAIVHFLNNIFKLALFKRYIDKEIVFKFGVPAIFAALLGAWLLTRLSEMKPILEYGLGNKIMIISPLKLTVGLLLLFFATIEFIPSLNLRLSKKNYFLGGILSGFFGGLSGNQGALRSAFLIKHNLSKETYIASGVAIACIIDISRLGIYIPSWPKTINSFDITLVLLVTLFAFTGAFLGTKLFKKVTLRSIQIITALMLYIFSMALILGLI